MRKISQKSAVGPLKNIMTRTLLGLFLALSYFLPACGPAFNADPGVGESGQIGISAAGSAGIAAAGAPSAGTENLPTAGAAAGGESAGAAGAGAMAAAGTSASAGAAGQAGAPSAAAGAAGAATDPVPEKVCGSQNWFFGIDIHEGMYVVADCTAAKSACTPGDTYAWKCIGGSCPAAAPGQGQWESNWELVKQC